MKHVITLIDGTSRNARVEKVYSNIYRLNLSIREKGYNKKTGRYDDQIVMYYPGIGSSLTRDRLKSKFLGYGIVDLIKDAYVNIASNYCRSDKLYLFGFSRGAVAVRILAGFIGNFGLLKPDHIDLLEFAWEYYELISGKIGPHQTFSDWLAFRISNTSTSLSDNIRTEDVVYRNVGVEFMGLFDAVPGGADAERAMVRRFNIGDLCPARGVKTAVHLVSIDETRWAFAPLLWNKKDENEAAQTIEQIWMPGVHTDVGGGYRDSFLSNLALLTMIDKMQQYDLSIQFYDDYLKEIRDEVRDRHFSCVINEESMVPYFVRRSLLSKLYKTRKIKRISRSVIDDYKRDVPGIYNSIHPYTFKILNNTIIYKKKQASYRPDNVNYVDKSDCFVTEFYDDEGMFRFCGLSRGWTLQVGAVQ